MSELTDEGVEVVAANLAIRDQARPALEDVQTAFLICGDRADRPRTELAFGEVAAECGVRVVKMSAYGAGPEAPTPLRWHHETETGLRELDRRLTVLRPNSLMDNFVRQGRTSIARGRLLSALGVARVSFLDARDLVEVAVLTVTDEQHAGQLYNLTGTPASAQDVATAAGRALDLDVVVVPQSLDALRAGLLHRGLPPAAADAVVELHAFFGSGAAAEESPWVSRLLHQPARTLTDSFRTHRSEFTGSLGQRDD